MVRLYNTYLYGLCPMWREWVPALVMRVGSDGASLQYLFIWYMPDVEGVGAGLSYEGGQRWCVSTILINMVYMVYMVYVAVVRFVSVTSLCVSFIQCMTYGGL
jgi:hypothetical protein